MMLFSVSTNKIVDKKNLWMTQIYHSDKVNRTEQLNKPLLHHLLS